MMLSIMMSSGSSGLSSNHATTALKSSASFLVHVAWLVPPTSVRTHSISTSRNPPFFQGDHRYRLTSTARTSLSSWLGKGGNKRKPMTIIAISRRSPYHKNKIATTRRSLRRRHPTRLMSTTSTDSSSISTRSAEDELQWLSDEIQRHNDLYYNQHVPEVSDDVYDALQFRRKELWNDVDIDVVVGSALPKTTPKQQRKTHIAPMLSLDNVHSSSELMQWLQSKGKSLSAVADDDDAISRQKRTVTLLTEPKLDGVSLSLRYERQNDNVYMLRWASTRGDGKEGQDVTGTVIHMMNATKKGTMIPERIVWKVKSGTSSLPQIVEVRGEVVLPQSIFHKLVQDHQVAQQKQKQLQAKTEEKERKVNDGNGTATNATNTSSSSSGLPPFFSNARNAASGILLRKDPTTKTKEDDDEGEETAKLRSMLEFFAYDLVAVYQQRNNKKLPLDGVEIRDYLENFGFQIPTPIAITQLELPESALTFAEQDLPNTTEDDSSKPVSKSKRKMKKNAAPSSDVKSGRSSQVEDDQWWWCSSSNSKGRPEDVLAPMLTYYQDLLEHRQSAPMLQSIPTTRKSRKSSKKSAHQPPSAWDWGDYDMDGCVHKVSESVLRQKLGSTKRSPRWAIAHKFPPESAISTLQDIIVQVGRTGALTPVAVLDPVEVGGVQVQRATLHNFLHMRETIGGNQNNTQIPVGIPVLVRRAGDVIPQVVQLVQDQNIRWDEQDDNHASKDASTPFLSLLPPQECPACGSPVVFEKLANASKSSSTSSDSSQIIRCGGPPLLCPPRAITSLQYAYSRDALDVTGFSKSRIQQLLDEELIRFPGDIFTLSETTWEEIEGLSGWGPKSCENLRSTAEEIARTGVSLDRYLLALSIRHLGKFSCEVVASTFGTVEAFLQALDAGSEWKQDPRSIDDDDSEAVKAETDDEANAPHPFSSLEEVNGIGPVLLQSLIEFAKNPEQVAWAKELSRAIVVHPIARSANSASEKSTDVKTQPLPWDGFSVVFTGSLGKKGEMTRSEAQRAAKQLGAKSTPSKLTKSTNMVVIGDNAGSKLRQTEDLGITTMTAEAFVLLCQEHDVPVGK